MSKESKCIICKHTRGDHQAKSLNCPSGKRTRIGWTSYRKTKFTKEHGPSPYYPLFKHMHDNHGLILLDSELDDIMDAAVELHNAFQVEQNTQHEVPK